MVNRSNRAEPAAEGESEISGYLSLGMVDEALKIARKRLAKNNLAAAEFNEAIDAVLVGERLPLWRTTIEEAYGRLSRPAKGLVRMKMLSFYFSIDDFATAAEFISTRNCNEPAELYLTMDVLLGLDRLEEARGLARRCHRAAAVCSDDVDQAAIIHALASFYARTGEWSRAAELWSHMPMHSPLLRNALVGVVELQAAAAIVAVRNALAVVHDKKRDPDTSLEIELPGLEVSINADIEKELLTLGRRLERVVPPKRQREFGIRVRAI